MSKMDANTRNEVTDAAVMQSLSQSPYVRNQCNPPVSFSQVIDSYNRAVANGSYTPDSTDAADMKILSDYVNSHRSDGAAEYIVQDCSSYGPNGKNHSVLVSAGNNTYVGFDGTGPNGWIDDGQGLYMESTELQRAAAKRFDDYANNYPGIMSRDNNIVVTGHSKGGNNAMYVTMSADNADLIDSCISLDGEGFSQAAIDKWQKSGVYDDRVSKIISVSGKYDFVHELGIPIASKSYTVDYRPWGSGINNPMDAVGSLHSHEYLFGLDENGNVVLNPDCKPGPQERVLSDFMAEYMKLSRAEIEASAPEMMALFQLVIGDHTTVAADGTVVLPTLTGILWALMRTSNGKKLLLLLAPLLVMYLPHLMNDIWRLIFNLLAGKLNEYKEETVTTEMVSQLIKLDQESFIGLRSSFNSVFEEAFEATQYAEKAERVQHNVGVSEALTKAVNRKSEAINEIMNIVVDSFSTTDKNLASEARKLGESYLGHDVYTMAST